MHELSKAFLSIKQFKLTFFVFVTKPPHEKEKNVHSELVLGCPRKSRFSLGAVS